VILNVVYAEAFPELTPSREQRAAENRQVLFDTGRSEDERLEALNYFDTYLGGVNLAGADVVDAGLSLLESASSPQFRLRVLYALDEVNDPRLVPSLHRLLAYDTDPAVRRLSASTLAKFSDDPGVREMLELAEANDADPSVREAAAVAKLPAAARMQHRREVFFDEDLTPATRLMELNIGISSSNEGPIEMDQEIARELVDIAANGPRTDDRTLALTVLYYVESFFPEFEPDPALRLPLLDMLANDPEQSVRGSAAHALRLFAGEPDVRAALEDARDNSPDRLTRNAAAHALETGR
jgi:HEAT repeat protein